MITSQPFATVGVALAVCVLLWRVFSRFRRAFGRQQLRLLRVRLAAYLFPLTLVAVLLGVSAHPWIAAAQIAGVALGVAAATYSFRTTKLEVVSGTHYYTPNPYIGSAIVAVFVARVLYKLFRLYGATGGFAETPEAIFKNPLSASIAGLILGFYAWQAWQLLHWYKSTKTVVPDAGGAKPFAQLETLRQAFLFMRIPPLKSWLIFAAGFACCFVSVIALLCSAYYFWAKPMLEKKVKQIQLAPPDFPTQQPAEFDFAPVGKNAMPLNFADYRGRIVVLNIWATWCMPCMAELPSFGKLAAHYSGDKDVAVICLSQESADTIFKSRGAMDSDAPIFSLSGHPLPSIYKTDGIPATFVIDKRGMIVFKHIGSIDWSHPSVIKFIDSLKQMPNQAKQRTPFGHR